MIIAQLYDRKLVTKQEIRYTTTAGTIIQLMGSDDQYSFPEFPIVLAYNRVNHYLATCYLSDDSLVNWKAAQIHKHLEAANQFYIECQSEFLKKEPMLATEMEALFVGASEVYHKLRDRAKLGTTAATTVPLTLTGKKPKRSDVIGRWAKFPEKDRRLLEIMPQPHFEHQLENPALPQYLQHQLTRNISSGQSSQTDPVQILPIGEQVPQTSLSVPVSIQLPPDSSTADVSSIPAVPPVLPRPTSASKPGSTSDLPPGGSQVQSSQPVNRKKRKAVKESIVEEGQVDDDDRDPEYDPNKDQAESEEEEPEQEVSGEGASGGVTLSQAESIQKGIPQLPKKRKVVKEENLIYPCKICPRRFQRTSELRDHAYVEHLGQTYDCADCLKSYQTQKAYKNHVKIKHKGLGKVKCTQEGCPWEDADAGKLHNHLLKVHNIGEPIQCNIVLENGKKCGKIFTNTRSFQTHAGFHMEKSLPCDQCDHHFSTELRRTQHIQRYHSKQLDPSEQWQCDICGKVFDQERVLKNHKSLHMLQHHKQLQAQKKKEAEEEAKKKEKEKGEEGNSNQSSQPSENQPEPQPGSSTQSSVAEDPQSQGSSFSPGDILGSAVIVKKQEGDEEDPDLEDVLSLI